MTRLFLVLVVVLTVLALVEAGKGGKNNAKKCKRLIKRFEKCLKKGYKSEGCISGDGELNSNQLKKCKKVEKKVKKCDYTCKKPEPTEAPEPTPSQFPYHLKCKVDGYKFEGDLLESIHTKSFEDCALKCTEKEGCRSITRREFDTICHLYGSNGGGYGASVDPWATSMNMRCDRSHVDTSCKKVNFEGLYYSNSRGTHFHELYTKSLEECALACRDKGQSDDRGFPPCKSITFFPGESMPKSDLGAYLSQYPDKSIDPELYANKCWLFSKKFKEDGMTVVYREGVIYMDLDC